jgi:cytidylate kinase
MRIAIDGPAAAGKTTLARELARRFGFLFVPTGAMYRAAALAKKRGLPPDKVRIEVAEGGRVILEGEDVTELLSSPDLDELSSQVAVDTRVRRHLVSIQRAIAAGRQVVMEGRDIGTVVLPEAELKIFLWATPEERARRRLKERGGDYQEILAAIRRRDERDSTRKDSPLRPAPDAVFLDTTGLPLEEVLERAIKLVEERRAQLAGR